MSPTSSDDEYTARQEIHMILEDDLLKQLPLLVFANKQDAASAITASEVL